MKSLTELYEEVKYTNIGEAKASEIVRMKGFDQESDIATDLLDYMEKSDQSNYKKMVVAVLDVLIKNDMKSGRTIATKHTNTFIKKNYDTVIELIRNTVPTFYSSDDKKAINMINTVMSYALINDIKMDHNGYIKVMKPYQKEEWDNLSVSRGKAKLSSMMRGKIYKEVNEAKNAKVTIRTPKVEDGKLDGKWLSNVDADETSVVDAIKTFLKKYKDYDVDTSTIMVFNHKDQGMMDDVDVKGEWTVDIK